MGQAARTPGLSSRPGERGPEEGGAARWSPVTVHTEQFGLSRPHRASSGQGLGEGLVSDER